ncbi:MAG: hypothetical protein Q4D96_08340 [Propionibacteriaceae bacterium]|nr:hypothetical protein [Propionibacteriaceae bacterium]
MELAVDWYDTAPIAPSSAIKRLGEELERQKTPLREVVLGNKKKNYRTYMASAPIGRIGVAAGSGGWNVFYSPVGARGFISLWDWEECVYGKPRPKSGDIPTDESVEWILRLLRKEEAPDINLECVEKMAQAVDRRVARDRWLGPLITVGLYLLVFGVLVWAGITDSKAGVVVGVTALSSMVASTFAGLRGRISRWRK